MEIRPDGYGLLLITDEGRKVAISPQDALDIIQAEVPRIMKDWLMLDALLAGVDDEDIQCYLEKQGATVTWE